MEMNFEKPKSRSAAKSRTAVQSAPLWEMKEMLPQAGILREKLAFRLTSGRGLITPRQFGPTRRTLASLQRETIRFSISSPSPPTSRNPAETITIPLTPFSIASCTAPPQSFGGRMMMARSTLSAIALIEGNVFTLRIDLALGFTG